MQKKTLAKRERLLLHSNISLQQCVMKRAQRLARARALDIERQRPLPGVDAVDGDARRAQRKEGALFQRQRRQRSAAFDVALLIKQIVRKKITENK